MVALAASTKRWIETSRLSENARLISIQPIRQRCSGVTRLLSEAASVVRVNSTATTASNPNEM